MKLPVPSFAHDHECMIKEENKWKGLPCGRPQEKGICLSRSHLDRRKQVIVRSAHPSAEKEIPSASASV